MLQIAHIGFDEIQGQHGHPSINATVHGAGFVARKIMSGLGPQKREDSIDRIRLVNRTQVIREFLYDVGVVAQSN